MANTRKYSHEFKQEALSLIVENGYTQAEELATGNTNFYSKTVS